MAPLFLFVVVTLLARIRSGWRDACRFGLAGMFLVTGLSHFVPSIKHELAAMIPPPFTGALWMIYATGALELAGAVGLLDPRFRHAAGIGLVLLLGLFPANVYAAAHDVILRGNPAMSVWLRGPLQVFWLWLLWWSSIRRTASPSLAPAAAGIDPFRRVKAWSGDGTLTGLGQGLACRFQAHQRGDGTIIIDCDSDEPHPHGGAWEAELAGTTVAGEAFRSIDAHVASATIRMGGQRQGTSVRLRATRLEVGSGSGASQLRYGLANMHAIRRNEVYARAVGESRTEQRRCARLNVGGLDLMIEPRQDADAILKEAASVRGSALSAELTVAPLGGQSMEAIDEAMGKVCALFSLGQGSAVVWLYRESLAGAGNIVATHCVDAITKPHGAAHRLIADGDLCGFVQATFPAWDSADEKWGIRNAILGYTDAKIQVDYHELRALKMAIVIEHLKSVFLDRTGREYILPDDVFQAAFRELRRGVTNALKDAFPGQLGQTLEQLAAGVAGMNRTSFRNALRGVAAELRLPLEKEELDALVPVRNRLVHAMRFADDIPLSHIEQYNLLTTFTGRLLLAALEYDGSYYDWTQRPPVLVRLNRVSAAEPPTI